MNPTALQETNLTREFPILGTYMGPTLKYLQFSLILNLLTFDEATEGWKTIKQIKEYDLRETNLFRFNCSDLNHPSKNGNARNYHLYLKELERQGFVKTRSVKKGEPRQYRLIPKIFTLRLLFTHFSIFDAAQEFYLDGESWLTDEVYCSRAYSYHDGTDTHIWTLELKDCKEEDTRQKLTTAKQTSELSVRKLFIHYPQTKQLLKTEDVAYLKRLRDLGVIFSEDNKQIFSLGEQFFERLQHNKLNEVLLNSQYYHNLPQTTKRLFAERNMFSDEELRSVCKQSIVSTQKQKLFEEYTRKYGRKDLIQEHT